MFRERDFWRERRREFERAINHSALRNTCEMQSARTTAASGCGLPLPIACGMIAAMEKAEKQCGMSTGRL
jgi:hypothetical protein